MTEKFASQLDSTAFIAQHETIWANRDYAAGSLMTINAATGFGVVPPRPFHKVGTVKIEDAEAAWKIIERQVRLQNQVWMSVNAMDSSVQRKPGRGGRAEVNAMVALVVDLDTDDGVHSNTIPNPTTAEVEKWIAELPIGFEPSLVIQSGGGFHLYYSLLLPLDWQIDIHAELISRHKAYWETIAASHGRNIDKGVLGRPDQLLRPAGSMNLKAADARLVRIVSNTGRRFTHDELRKFLPELTPPEPRTIRPLLLPASVRDSSETTVNAALSIGDQFAFQVSASELAVAVWGALRTSGNGIIFPRKDGSTSEDANARVYPATETDPEKITMFGQRVIDQFKVPDSHSLSSFDLLATLFSGEFRYKAAAKILHKTVENDKWGEALFRRLQMLLVGREQPLPATYPTMEQNITIEQSARTQDSAICNPKVDRKVEAINSMPRKIDPNLTQPLTVRQAIASGHGEIVLEEGALKVCFGRGPHVFGVYKGKATKTYLDGVKESTGWETVWTRIANYIPQVGATTNYLAVDPVGAEYEVGDPHFQVTIRREDGSFRSADKIDRATAFNIKSAVQQVNFGVPLPISTDDRAHLSNVLLTLGFDDLDGAPSKEYTGTGWLLDSERDGRAVYLAPGGSMSASGSTQEYKVGVPPNSEAGSITKAAEKLGYQDVPQSDVDIREVALEALPAFLAITPTRKDLGYAGIGMVFAAPLALKKSCTLFIVGDPQAGKTWFMSALQGWVSGERSGASFTGGALAGDSRASGIVGAVYLRHSVGFWDDYFMGETSRENDTTNALTTALIKMSFGDASAGRGTQSGGAATKRIAATTSVMTGEALPPGGAGIISRIIPVSIAKGEVAISPKGTSPYDRFADTHFTAARQLHGAYVQWLAQRIDAVGSLEQFGNENDAIVRYWSTADETRAASNVAIPAAGWNRLREFATEKGFADVLPSEEIVDRELRKLVTASNAASSDASPAKRVLEKISGSIATKEYYIELADGKIPEPKLARLLGWRERTNSSQFGPEIFWEPGGYRAGTLSYDGRAVVVLADTVGKARRAEGLQVPAQQLHRAAIPLVVEGTVPGGKAPTKYLGTRPRSWVVTPESLDIDLSGFTFDWVQPATEPATNPVQTDQPLERNESTGIFEEELKFE